MWDWLEMRELLTGHVFSARSSCSSLVPVEGSCSADCCYSFDGLLRRPQHRKHRTLSDLFHFPGRNIKTRDTFLTDWHIVCYVDDILYTCAVFHRCYAVGHGAGASWDCQWDPVCTAEQHQPEVWRLCTQIIKMGGSWCPAELSHFKLTVPFVFSPSLEVGSCIAVQVCMIQIPLLILFNSFYVRSAFV